MVHIDPSLSSTHDVLSSRPHSLVLPVITIVQINTPKIKKKGEGKKNPGAQAHVYVKFKGKG
jgi:hypothetical protein